MVQRETQALLAEIDSAPLYPRRAVPAIRPFDLPPLGRSETAHMRDTQEAFDRAFPPVRTGTSDVLIISWAEIERQFLDLSAPWDLQESAFQIRQARQMAALESAEKTMRWLFVLSHGRPGIDTPEPIWGTGDSLPMP
jgi:hypothetical protein